MEFHVTAMECHLPYRITRRTRPMKLSNITYIPIYAFQGVDLSPDTSEQPRLNPSQTGRYSLTYPGGMEGWVDLGNLLHTEMFYPLADASTNRVQCQLTALIEANALTTTLRRHLYIICCWWSGKPADILYHMRTDAKRRCCSTQIWDVKSKMYNTEI